MAIKNQPALKRKSDRVIFFDIDGTLVDNNSDNLCEIKRKIVELKADGLLFGINTSRSWIETKYIYNNLLLNAPTICENGSYYLLNSEGKKNILFNADSDLRKKIVIFLKNNIFFNDYKIIVSNNKKILLDKKIDRLIFITSNRKYTASIYVRWVGKINQRGTKKIMAVIKKNFSKLEIEIISEDGKIIVSSLMVDKILTLSYIQQKYFRKKHIIMISDNEKVKTIFSHIDFYSVNRSSKEYNKRCLYVSNKKGTRGVLDIINNYL